MGSFLITETMSRRHKLAMESYDRLFPNQDTMPKGGFGNLIALPQQRVARDSGNALFLAAALEPFTDQWGYLAGLGTMTPASVARARNTLVLVHRRPLLDQWVAQLALFLGLEPKAIGQIGGAKSKPSGIIDVAMIQSLIRKNRVDDLGAGYGHVIVDECHHVSAVSFERVLSAVKARYIIGLTATPQRRDGHQPISAMQLGPVRFAVNARDHAAGRPFGHKLIVKETSFLAEKVPQKRSPIVLTERIDHLEHFAARLKKFTRNFIVLHERLKLRERREVMARLAAQR